MDVKEIINYLTAILPIEGKVFNQELFIDLDKIDFTDGNFKNCEFLSSVTIINHNAIGSFLTFEKCIFHKRFKYLDSQNDSIHHFRNCSFANVILHNLIIDEFIFEDCILNGVFRISNKVRSDFNIENIQPGQNATMKINSKEVDMLMSSKFRFPIVSVYEIKKLQLLGEFDKINISASEFTSIEVNNIVDKDHQNKPAKIGEIKFQETNFQGVLTLEDLIIENLVFTGLNTTNGSIRFNEITIKDTNIYDCTISNFYWNQVKFINPPDLIRSDLSALKMANVFWGNDKRLANSFLDEKIKLLYGLRKKWLKKSGKDFDYENISELKYQIETYRQLKAASISNHNPIEGLTFYRNEMKLYWKLIRIEGGIPWYDRFLIFINRWSSDFGQNWFLPLLWISITTSIFYFGIEKPTLSYKPLDILNGILEVLYYVNPIRKIDENLPKAVQGLDVLLRAVNAYFIYHFIKASRKFGKM